VSGEPIPLDQDLLRTIAREAGAPIAQPPTIPPPNPTDGLNLDGVLITPTNNNKGFLLRLDETEAARTKAANMQQRSRGKYRENRIRQSEEGRQAAAEIVDTVADAMGIVQNITTGPIDKMADQIVRMNGNLILNGGPMFAPTSAREASDMAKQWATIANQYRTSAAAKKLMDTTSKDVSGDVLSRLTELATNAQTRAAASKAKAGQVHQIVDDEDDE
jgi:hypothetical protein